MIRNGCFRENSLRSLLHRIESFLARVKEKPRSWEFAMNTAYRVYNSCHNLLLRYKACRRFSLFIRFHSTIATDNIFHFLVLIDNYECENFSLWAVEWLDVLRNGTKWRNLGLTNDFLSKVNLSRVERTPRTGRCKLSGYSGFSVLSFLDFRYYIQWFVVRHQHVRFTFNSISYCLLFLDAQL